MYSRIGIYRDNKFEIITDKYGNSAIPSVVALTEDGMALCGEAATTQALENPERTIFGFVQFLGHTFNDPITAREGIFLPSAVINRDSYRHYSMDFDNRPVVFSPEDVATSFFVHLKSVASEYMNQNITRALVTVPWYFNDSARKATRRAAEMAGFKLERIMNEPWAAGFGLDFNHYRESNFLVFDFGGYKLDVSVVEGDTGVIEAVAAESDTNLGGIDLDKRIVDFWIKEIQGRQQSPIQLDKIAMDKLTKVAERAKIILSSQLEARVEIKNLTENIDFEYTLTRSRFEELNKDLFDRAVVLVDLALKAANVTKTQIVQIAMIGGSSYIPKIRQLISQYCDGRELLDIEHPEEACVRGAASHAKDFCYDPYNDLYGPIDAVPLNLGIETVGNNMTVVLRRGTIIPRRYSIFVTTSRDGQSKLRFKIYQGQHNNTKLNKYFGEFELTGLEPAPRGSAFVEVTFDTENGLTVTALDKQTGRSSTITIPSDDMIVGDEYYQFDKDEDFYAAEAAAETEAQTQGSDSDSEDVPQVQTKPYGPVHDEL